MSYSRLETKQILPITLEKAWDFFSNPANLAIITPDYMDFKITSPIETGDVYPGQIITYELKPLLGISTSWMTEITQVRAPHYFVDSQLSGPYKFWHHEHHFTEVDGGVELVDLLYYALPFGPFGKLVSSFFVRKRVENIFEYRRQKLDELFG